MKQLLWCRGGLNLPYTLMAVLITALCWVTYSNIFDNGFLVDDYLFFSDSKKLLQNTDAAELFRHGFNFTYRPVGFLLLKWEYIIFQWNPAGYHAVNLLIFSGICLLIFLILDQLLKNTTVSFLATCLYAAHPVNNFLLNYKTASNLSLFILNSFIAMWLFIKFMRGGTILWLISSLLFYFIAMLCHEIAFFLPLYLLLTAYCFGNREGCSGGLNLHYGYAYIIPAAAFLWLRVGSTQSTKITGMLNAQLPFFQAWNTFIKLVGWYLAKLLFPVNVLFMWEEKLANNAPNLLNLLILTCWVAALIHILRKKRQSPWGFAFIVFSTGLLTAFFASFTYTRMLKTALIEPHWLGFSSLGFFLLLALGLSRLRKTLLTAGLILLLAGWTHHTNRLWQDDRTYSLYWLNLNSINATPWQALARRYVLENQNAPTPDCARLARLGLMFHILLDAEKAYQYYNSALKMDERCASAYYGLGVLHYDLEEFPKYSEAFAKARQLRPEQEEAYQLLAQVFSDQGQKDYYRRIKKILGKEDIFNY